MARDGQAAGNTSGSGYNSATSIGMTPGSTSNDRTMNGRDTTNSDGTMRRACSARRARN